eukprot:TRINITY_DN5451_c0_g1_i3.p1 TRINITY_DN5451_c0_g1~~TRINITY_DN5451_c0_g1_i3.p1  ORF type:complete len:190 (+),score=34.58 TRINITY_DN5451_c0_g1_i3:14-583(+)
MGNLLDPQTTTSHNNNDIEFKINLVGDSSSGKSSLLSRFAEDTFTESYIPTIGADFRVKTVEIDGRRVKLRIWDIREGTKSIKTQIQYFRGSRAIIIVYDITDRASYENVTQWYKDINDCAPEYVQKMLIGNKCDLEVKREVGYDDARELAESLSIPFLETSAKDSTRVKDAFVTIAKLTLNNYLKNGN